MRLLPQRWTRSSNNIGERLLRFVMITPVTTFFIMLFLSGCISLAETASWAICVTGGVFAGMAMALVRQ